MKKILPVIVVAQFFCTSVWFSGNAVAGEIMQDLHLGPSFLAYLTSAVQFGFIIGTLVFAFYRVADRFSPSFVFLICAILAAVCNVSVVLLDSGESGVLCLRFLTGFCLAGIYPVGMKIASDHFQQGLGKSLGYLVGALVLGTALPHLLKSVTTHLPWKYVMITSSVLCLSGGGLMYRFVPDGPYHQRSQPVRFFVFLEVFRHKAFRSAALGYFGHMWELYTFWAFLPFLLNQYQHLHSDREFPVSIWSFLIIGSGSIACILGGLVSHRYGTKKIAKLALRISGCCCILSPFLFFQSSEIVFLLYLIIWGMSVVADSPLFSTLVAKHAPADARGSALTLVTCLGFAITIVSIQLMGYSQHFIPVQYLFLLLAPGPVLGLVAIRSK
jgi:MFS family permease